MINYSELFQRATAAGLPITDARGRFTRQGMRWTRRSPGILRGAVVHQTAGGDDFDALARYHTGRNHITAGLAAGHPFKDGLPSVAYTFFINKRGAVFLANDIEAVTWSHGDRLELGDENELFMSICLGGKFRAKGWPAGTEDPTAAQHHALFRLWDLLAGEFDFTALDLYGHHHFGKDTCPGDTVRSWIEARRASITDLPNDAESRQRALARLGYYKGAIDGMFGPRSRIALRMFLRDRGLPVTESWTYLATAEVVRLRKA